MGRSSPRSGGKVSPGAGHGSGAKKGDGFSMAAQRFFDIQLELGFLDGAGEENRTLMTSWEG